ncbi:unnamed protein product [Effrenium voratum]|nr:unnamed protein product [Effrenium voratum]
MCHATRRREHLLRLLVCVVPLLYAPVLIHSKSPTGGPGIVEPVQDSEPPRPSPKPPSSSEPNGALQATEIPDSDRGRRPLVTASMLYDTVDLLSTVYFMFFAAHVMRILALLRVLASPIIAPCRAILSIVCWLLFGNEKEMMRLFGEMLHQALVALQIALAHAREPLMLATVWIIDVFESMLPGQSGLIHKEPDDLLAFAIYFSCLGYGLQRAARALLRALLRCKRPIRKRSAREPLLYRQEIPSDVKHPRPAWLPSDLTKLAPSTRTNGALAGLCSFCFVVF